MLCICIPCRRRLCSTEFLKHVSSIALLIFCTQLFCLYSFVNIALVWWFTKLSLILLLGVDADAKMYCPFSFYILLLEMYQLSQYWRISELDPFNAFLIEENIGITIEYFTCYQLACKLQFCVYHTVVLQINTKGRET